MSWDDGGDPDRTFVAGDAPQAFHAVYAACADTETLCDGLDDDCDGVVDDVAPPAGVLEISVDADGLTWSGVSGAQGYDVVRGHFDAGGGSPFTATTTDACLASATPPTFLAFAEAPGPDEVWWFLVRPRNCGGPGSYDSFDPAQTGSRDPGVNSSASACP